MLPTDSKARKAIPLHSGVIAYFPDALCEVAKVSKAGNDQHNPGQPLHWAKEKSTDHEDCIARHTVDALQSKTRAERITHKANRAWRALADLQIELETPEAPVPPTLPKIKYGLFQVGDKIHCCRWHRAPAMPWIYVFDSTREIPTGPFTSHASDNIPALQPITFDPRIVR